jgi:predicted DCC family thiol-disulfide oxidoreductase YuxK
MPDPLDTPRPNHPLLLFDGDCAFCRAAIERWRAAAGSEIDFAPFQEAAARFPQIDAKECRRAVHYIDAEGGVSRGAEAVFRASADGRRKRWLLWLYTRLPPFAIAAELVYRLIAANRTPLAKVLHVWRGSDLKPPTYHIASALFLRLLGLVYLIAFVSLWSQISGLIGDQGILPADNFLAAIKLHCAQQQPPVSPLWHLPTLAWISPHDAFLKAMCAAGALLSCLLIFGLLQLPALVLLWVDYLSLFYVGQDFLGFQWDILLLETGFIAIFLAPFAWRSRLFTDRHPPRMAIWLLWWLLFRLMFESGAVKLTWNHGMLGPNGQPIANTWASLTALDFHYWTQPLPIWTSWYAAQLPHWFQKLSVIAVLVVELVLPWFLFGPRLLRYVACGGIALLMVLISATGNYNFFNLLTIVLALMLIDDHAWPRRLKSRIAGDDSPWLFSPTRWRGFLLVPFFGLALAIGTQQVIEAIAPAESPGPSIASRLGISQFVLVNDYGLFRRMTETRPEIVIEGSDDGTEWKPFEFRWKPGDLARPPRFNTPHQPRLDWQMWFEALRLEQIYNATDTITLRYADPWFQSFLLRLLQGDKPVLALLAKNPFPNAPPTFIRIILDQYRFTEAKERQATGNWWHRDVVWTGPAWSLGK